MKIGGPALPGCGPPMWCSPKCNPAGSSLRSRSFTSIQSIGALLKNDLGTQHTSSETQLGRVGPFLLVRARLVLI